MMVDGKIEALDTPQRLKKNGFMPKIWMKYSDGLARKAVSC